MKSRTLLLLLLLVLLGLPLGAEAGVSRYNYRVFSSATPSARIPQFIVADTEAELPGAAIADGDVAYTKDTDKFWLRSAGAWAAFYTAGAGPALAGDVDGAPGTNDLDELAVEVELEGVLDLQDLQGAVTDAQVPNDITIDQATLALTGDSATGFFPAGTVEIARGGTGQATAQAAIDALTNVAAATNEHVLTKDTATGNAVFKASSGGGGGPPPGANTEVIFNDSGAFGADAGMTYVKATDTLTVGALTIPSSASTEITFTGPLSGNISAVAPLFLTAGTVLHFGANATDSVWTIASGVGAHHLVPGADNSYDIGTASFAPRNIYAGTAFIGDLTGNADTATTAGQGDTPTGFFTSEDVAGPLELTIDNSNSGATSEGLVSVQSDSSRIDLRSLSGSHTAPADLAAGDGVVDSSSRLFLNGEQGVIFGTNNAGTSYTERARVDDGFMVGTTTDPGVGIVNVSTGYRIGNAAASGDVLGGNGSNYVATAITSYESTLEGVMDLPDLQGTLSVAKGGTGATTGWQGLSNLGSTRLRLAANSAVSVVAKQNLSGMAFILAANTNYSLSCTFANTSNATTVGVQYGATFTGTVVTTLFYLEHWTSGTTKTIVTDSSFPIDLNPTASQGAGVFFYRLEANIEVSGNGGTLQMTHGSETASLTTTLRGSWCRLDQY